MKTSSAFVILNKIRLTQMFGLDRRKSVRWFIV